MSNISFNPAQLLSTPYKAITSREARDLEEIGLKDPQGNPVTLAAGLKVKPIAVEITGESVLSVPAAEIVYFVEGTVAGSDSTIRHLGFGPLARLSYLARAELTGPPLNPEIIENGALDERSRLPLLVPYANY